MSLFPPSETYVLDTSVFIESFVRRYPMAVFPTFWKHLETLARAKKFVL